MKYMGSKRAMLENGLGALLRTEANGKKRVIDLFAGSGSVAWFAAQNLNVPVVACDLQTYSKWMSRAVIERTEAVNPIEAETKWVAPAVQSLNRSKPWKAAARVDQRRGNTGSWTRAARDLCDATRGSGLVWRAYGGRYYSPTQAVLLDTLRRGLPRQGALSWVCQGALLVAASRCAASPGHTAQPFATTRTAGPFLREAWMRDPIAYVRAALRDIGPRFAKARGEARISDAACVARQLNAGDLVFVDPPYSAVHYSRFYHVLETIARGWCGEVQGTGRYPPPDERPVSDYSQKTTAGAALERLFRDLAGRGCTTIVTFPRGECSNGLSGRLVQSTASEHFYIEHRFVKTRFSTLGGNGRNRRARHARGELMLVLKPR